MACYSNVTSGVALKAPTTWACALLWPVMIYQWSGSSDLSVALPKCVCAGKMFGLSMLSPWFCCQTCLIHRAALSFQHCESSRHTYRFVMLYSGWEMAAILLIVEWAS